MSGRTLVAIVAVVSAGITWFPSPAPAALAATARSGGPCLENRPTDAAKPKGVVRAYLGIRSAWLVDGVSSCRRKLPKPLLNNELYADTFVAATPDLSSLRTGPVRKQKCVNTGADCGPHFFARYTMVKDDGSTYRERSEFARFPKGTEEARDYGTGWTWYSVRSNPGAASSESTAQSSGLVEPIAEWDAIGE